MPGKSKSNGLSKGTSKKRYWVSVDLGLMGNFKLLYEWLDSHGAEECCSGLATFKSSKSRDRLGEELREILKMIPRARAYIISMDKGGRFVVGNRKAAQWTGFAAPVSEQVDES